MARSHEFGFIVALTVLAGCSNRSVNASTPAGPEPRSTETPPVETTAASTRDGRRAATEAPSTDDDDPLRPKLDSHVDPAYRCPVTVEAILSDDQYRGSPNTPSHQDWVAGLDPEDYEMYIAESHGESYRECTYRVRVQSKSWRFVLTFDTTFGDLPESWCEDAIDHAAAEIQRTTHGCKELHRGAYYGYDLVPIP